MSFDDRRTLASPTGAALSLHAGLARAPARGVVHINHGLAEHAARYAPFAAFLNRRGYHVYAHDHRGHGFTRAPGAPRGRFAAQDGVDALIADVNAVHDLIAQEHAGLPVVILGHSMGGMIALNHVLRHSPRLHGAAIWNSTFQAGLPALAARALLAWERFRLGADVPSRLLPKLTFEAWGKAVSGRRTMFDWLSHDPRQVDAYIADPLCGWNGSVSLWLDLFRLARNGATDANFANVRKSLPLHLVGGAHDPATAGGKSVEHLAGRLRRMGFTDITSTIYPGMRHESLNEIGRERIMGDFAGWLDGICA